MFWGRSSPRASARQKPRFESSKWRVVCTEPLPVSAEADSSSAKIGDLEPNSKCDVVHKEVQTDRFGNTRAMIIDPVWKGWVTLRTDVGDSNLEHLEGADDGAESLVRLTASAASALIAAPAVAQTTPERIRDLQFEAMADDIDCDFEEMVLWSEDEVSTFFLSGGATTPPLRKKQPAASTLDISDAAEGGGAAPAAAMDAEEHAAPPKDVEMSAGQRKLRDAGEWPKGMMVLLSGLTSMRELNGRSGVVQSFDVERGRYDVRMANRVVRAKPAQLSVHPLQKQKDEAGRGDEVVFLTEDAMV